MNELQKYREKFRKEVVPSYYSAKWHIFFLVIMVLTFFIATLQQIQSFHWMGVLIFGATIFYSNLHVYLIHRFTLHRRVWGLHWAHDMHIIHHQLYVDEKIEFEEWNDLYMLLMPPKILLMYYFVYCPLVLSIVYLILPLHLFWYSALGFSLWFGYYELIHFIEHMPRKHWIMKFPYFRFLRRFHEVHHSQKLKNIRHFDIAIPMFDYLFKTNDKLRD